MAWNRKLWGVLLITGRSKPNLIGCLWMNPRMESQYEGEPSRALLFTTRRLARIWCSTQNVKYSAYPAGHVCRSWRVRAVQVRETVSETTRPNSLAQRRTNGH